MQGLKIQIKLKHFLCVIFLCFTVPALAQHEQEKALHQSKLSPNLAQRIYRQLPAPDALYIVAVKHSKQFSDSLNKIRDCQVISIYEPAGIFLIKTNPAVINRIIRWESVLFIDMSRKPVEELFTGTMDGSTNLVNKLHTVYPAFNGNSVTVGIKESNFDTSDIEFKGRYLFNPNASQTISSHASVMGTITAGGGNSWYATRGVAWAGKIVSSSFANLFPDAVNFYQQFNVSVQNHSYGTGIENYYGAEAMAYDLFALNNPTILPVFSAGNSGNQSSQSGIYTGIPGVANLTGNFKMAKNIITVGATDSFYSVANLSSRGPAFDGRVKPELVALGEDGSSGAAALVSGVSAVLQQAYKLNNNGLLPSATLIKSILMNSSDDIDNPGVDFKSGFGSLNAYKAMQSMANSNFINGTVSQSQQVNYNLNIPAGIKKVKLTVCWNDPPATVNAAKALVNDLDIELITPASQILLPWVLNHFPHIDSMSLPAVRKKDSLNNVEQISLDNPVAGVYIIRVKGHYVITGSQNFSIAWQLDTASRFEWNFPTTNDPVLSGVQNIIRWKSTLASATGLLSYSIDNGVNWQLINNNLDLNAGFFKWMTPQLNTKAILKISDGVTDFISNEFVISKRPFISVGFNCADSFMLYWSKSSNASRYYLYRLGANYMEQFLNTTDTSVILMKNGNPGYYYSVSPVISDREGVKSFTINYTQQGVTCYIKSFYAEKINNTARINLELGTLYGISKVKLLKIRNGDTSVLQTINNPAQPVFMFLDNQLQTGLQQYRISIEITGGSIIYSDIAPLYFADEDALFVFPNPVKIGNTATVVLSQLHRGELQLTNMNGKIMSRWPVTTDLIPVKTDRLQAGVYLLRLAGNSKKIIAGKLVVY